ncbi:exodeoxyribonuclease 7 large subunit domain protein [Burkholderia pseudomallei MSHR7500]|nr:exodeoxyribonuclease 7 large subunit domain protein [Burkholderia pseudomallei]KGS80881.1 exodeoxyribonuclease 7 large subunit domain protein [Burkholderia pseudomallei MSHR7500]
MIEKYQWPLAARVKFDTSPATHSSGNVRSSIVPIARLSADTGMTPSPAGAPPEPAKGDSECMDGRKISGAQR